MESNQKTEKATKAKIRNPTCTAIEDDEFYDCLDNILSTPHETLIRGDFNLPHVNWTTHQRQAPGSKLIDLMNTNSLQQHVNEPTRGNSILDLEILSDGVFTVEEVEKQLSILNPYKSTGLDGLGPQILKETAEVISEPPTNIFNRSLETGMVPDDWKCANITPIFKKGNKQIPNNYRPISLTSVISKTIERLLKVRITKHLNYQNLINDTHQHGFREKRSCLANLVDFFGEVNRTYDRTKAVDFVYLDFQKVFDKVLYERLMAKVEAHGIRGNYSRWMRN
ncbi:Endonuclease/exonuclease/phosphatase [Trinorchestia longiramus]|nr:Endonuclease/exonuclease/phosphatase [Trinorchestia longiramus]